MNSLKNYLVLILLLSGSLYQRVSFENKDVKKYNLTNLDSTYTKYAFDKIITTLNQVHFKVTKRNYEVYTMEKGLPNNFFVYDIVDTTNNTINSKNIKFLENHIYHFAAKKRHYSFSNICIVHKGKIVIYEAVNCKCCGKSINSVIHYLKEHLKVLDNALVNRVKNYRNYNDYYTMEDVHDAPLCDE